VADDVLRLSDHESLRIIRQSPDELEVGATWAPGGSPPPADLHPAQDEHFEVQTGHLRAMVGGTQRDLGPGDALQIPRGTPHKMWNAGAEPATAVWRTRPAGRTAGWFETVDRLTAGGTRKPPLPGLAKALTEYADVFRLVIRPKPLRPFVYLLLRVVALAGR
jgi:mannose-6-phosphate isomerase-like protein (cupin superfamily)